MSLSSPDLVGAVLRSALDGLSLRQQVIADNIANVDTPHYRASAVDFESALRAAVDSGDPADLASPVSPVVTATNTPVGANDNNVDLRKETLAAVQSQFQYQVLSRAASDRFSMLKIVAGGQ